MNTPAIQLNSSTLVVGLGSPHGDDQAGWKVVERLKHQIFTGIEMRQAKVPHDLIDWLGEQDSLHLIDACMADHHIMTPQRFNMLEVNAHHRPSLQFKNTNQSSIQLVPRTTPIQLRSAGSHQIDAFTVLELASSLKRLPKHVVLWAVPGNIFRPGSTLSFQCETAITACVEQLAKELANA